MYSQIVFTQILSEGSLCEKSCVDELVKIFLCEGGNVELCSRTSKHIIVFVFDPLSLALSYFVYCIILSYHNMLVLIVCAHTCVQPRELYIAPQL